jgi:hypothetical protein
MLTLIFDYTIAENLNEVEGIAMKKKLKIAMMGISMFLMFIMVVFGTDPNDHLMRNDHDTLLIGEIISIDEDEMLIQVVEHIVSAHDLTEGDGQRQLKPDTVRVVIRDEQMGNFHVGDYLLASLNQEEDLFIVAWGVYKLDLVEPLDVPMWHVETDDMLTSIILSDFINQEGRYTYSVREDGKVIRHQEDAEIVIYDPNPPTEIQPRTEDNDEVEGDRCFCFDRIDCLAYLFI